MFVTPPRRAPGARSLPAATSIAPLAAAPCPPRPAPHRRGPGRGRRTSASVEKPRTCYVCKAAFTRCTSSTTRCAAACGDFNYAKRSQTADLRGRVALITGARVKIGYQAALMLLRAGARVIVTTRFPRDAAARYAREPDFAEWRRSAEVHGLDLRHTPSVEVFARYLEQTLERLDFLINNACQTVRRPPGFYAHLMEGEPAPLARAAAPERGAAAGYEAACRARARAAALGRARADRASSRGSRPACIRRRSRRSPCSTTTCDAQPSSSPRARSTPTCSRSTCASRTAGG